MSIQTIDYIDAVSRLPSGGRLTLYEVEWEGYNQLLDQLADHSHLRISYDGGRLEIMSPSAKHEKYKNLMHDLVLILGDEMEQDIYSYGSVTLKLQSRNKGAEGDDCFYIQHASQMAGKNRLDLSSDPAPDLVVEIDLTNESFGKFAIYAAMGIPEVWQYNGSRWQIWRLATQDYEPVTRSLAFSFLSVERIAEFVMSSETEGPYQARRGFRAWVKATRPGTL